MSTCIAQTPIRSQPALDLPSGHADHTPKDMAQGRGEMPAGMYDRDLDKCAANYVPLTPLSFLERAAAVYPDKPAVIHEERRYSYREFRERCHRLASALAKAGVAVGDTVAVLSPNIPATLEAHYGVPMAGAVL